MVNDIHLSDRPPSSCTDSYLDDLFDLLYQTSALAGDRGADGIILAGDIFHHKTPNRTSHATVMRLIDWARHTTNHCPVYAVLGNHDLSHDRVGSVDETQPLGVALKSGAIRLLDGWLRDGGPVYGVPWQMTFDDYSVSAALSDYRDDAWTRPQNIHLLVVTHAPLYPPGQELPYENYPATKWANAMANRGTVHYGHVHSPHGVYTVDGVTFSNCGALSRGSLTENNLTREIQVALWDSDTGQIEHITLTHRPAAEVFRLPEVTAQRAARLDLSSFLDNVGETTISITSTADVIDHIRSLGLEPTLEDLLRALLTEADA
jgi:predicted phosphodiesterase